MRPMQPTTPDSGDYYHPYFFSRAGDPVYTISCERKGRIACPRDGEQVAIPLDARPAGGTDHHMAVIDQASGLEWDFWNVQSISRGVIRTGTAARHVLDGPGNSTTEFACADAACVGLTAGMIRQPELEAGVIPHALFAVVACASDQSVFPAHPANSGVACKSSPIPYGQYFQLDLTDTEIDALDVTAWQRTLLRTLAHYGMFVADQGSNGAFEFEVESPATWADGTNPWIAYAERLRAAGGKTAIRTYRAEGSTRYLWDFGDGLTQRWWASHLHAVDPCVLRGTC
jgi:hypothetical protein